MKISQELVEHARSKISPVNINGVRGASSQPPFRAVRLSSEDEVRLVVAALSLPTEFANGGFGGQPIGSSLQGLTPERCRLFLTQALKHRWDPTNPRPDRVQATLLGLSDRQLEVALLCLLLGWSVDEASRVLDPDRYACSAYLSDACRVLAGLFA